MLPLIKTRRIRRRTRERQERKERENRRPILRMLRAALLRSFRGKHSEKIKGSTRGNWDPREVQPPFRPNPNEVGNYTTTLRRLLIGAVEHFGAKRLLMDYAMAVQEVWKSIVMPSPSNEFIHVANHCGCSIRGDKHQFIHRELSFLNKVFKRLKYVIFSRMLFHGKNCL